jgi:TolB protein
VQPHSSPTTSPKTERSIAVLPKSVPEDGSDIAFMSTRNGSAELFVMRADGSHAQSITSDEADHLFPAWSPDGRDIVYVHAEGGLPTGDFDLHVLVGGDDEVLTEGPRRDVAPAWSPNGDDIAYESAIAGEPNIYVISLASHRTVRITKVHAPAYQPSWSPDGRRIAFAVRVPRCTLSDEACEQHIWVADPDGSSAVELTSGKEHDGEPEWSPDGTAISFTSDRGERGNFDVWVMRADGSRRQRLTHNPMLDLNAVWSPDGSRMAFASNRDGDFEIYLMDADGNNQINISNDHTAQDATPSWR